MRLLFTRLRLVRLERCRQVSGIGPAKPHYPWSEHSDESSQICTQCAACHGGPLKWVDATPTPKLVVVKDELFHAADVCIAGRQSSCTVTSRCVCMLVQRWPVSCRSLHQGRACRERSGHQSACSGLCSSRPGSGSCPTPPAKALSQIKLILSGQHCVRCSALPPLKYRQK